MDPLLKLAIEIKNKEDIAKVTADLNAQKAAVQALNPSMANYGTEMAKIGAAAQRSSAELKSLQSASGHAGRGLGQLAYAIDDIQYGFNAIVNNIPQIVLGLGGGMGIAGALGIAAVAANQLIKHWTELGAVLQSNWSGGGAEQLKMLAERAEDAAKAWESLKKAQPEFSEKAGKAFKNIIAEGPPEDLQKRITDLMLATGQGAVKRDIVTSNSPITDWFQRKVFGRPTSEKEQSAMRYQETGQKAGNLLAQTQMGGQDAQQAFDQLRFMAKHHPESFKQEEIEGFEKSDPKKLKQAEQAAMDAKEYNQWMSDIEKIRHEALEQDRMEYNQWMTDIQKIRHEAIQNDIAEMKQWKDDIARIRVERLQQEKTGRIHALEDQMTEIEKKKHAAELKERLAGSGQSQVIGGGAKGAIDYYQTNVNNNERRKILLMERFDKEIRAIREKITVQQRVVIQK